MPFKLVLMSSNYAQSGKHIPNFTILIIPYGFWDDFELLPFKPFRRFYHYRGGIQNPQIFMQIRLKG